MICFDIRFPELSRMLAEAGAQLVCVPAAFNMTTGPAHWEVHFRSRALDNQMFYVGCAPARSETGYRSYGHSIAVSPWGDVLGELDFTPETLIRTLDLAQTERIREQLPLLSARRKDLYTLHWRR